MKITAHLFLSALVLVSLQAHAIIGGEKLDRNELPQVQMVKFSNTDNSESICTATLIGPKTIITAAHCLVDKDADAEFSVRGGGSVSIQKFIIHPGFNERLRNDGFAAQGDLAIGLLSDSVTSIEPITLSTQAPSVGNNNLVLGVGSPREEVRQFGYMNVTRVVDKEINFGKIERFKQTTAKGDSGGPILIKNSNNEVMLVAVNSTGAGTSDQSKRYGPYAGAYMMSTYRVGHGSIFDSFITTTVANEKLQVCGINLTCKSVKTSL